MVMQTTSTQHYKVASLLGLSKAFLERDCEFT